jgi:hypothetical protein
VEGYYGRRYKNVVSLSAVTERITKERMNEQEQNCRENKMKRNTEAFSKIFGS